MTVQGRKNACDGWSDEQIYVRNEMRVESLKNGLK